MQVKVDCANTQLILEKWLKAQGYRWENQGFTYRFSCRETYHQTQEWWAKLVRDAALNGDDLSKVEVKSYARTHASWR